MKLTLGFSPCPNDTFIFDALVHHKVDTEGLEFEYILADVEELNNKALEGKLDISKVSFHAFLFLTGAYRLLNSGAALGFGAGPLLIARQEMPIAELAHKRVAIPGRYTTANLLFSLAAPDTVIKNEMIFSDIEKAVLNGQVDAGVIIHEGRFTYKEKGLCKIADLGEFWEGLTAKPIPLGGIVARKDLGLDTICLINRCLRRSVAFALQSKRLTDFVRCNAQEMSEEVMMKHIGLYVNNYSLDLGKSGQSAVEELFKMACAKGIISEIPPDLFLKDIAGI